MINLINHTKRGECSNCGECCTDILPLTNYEIREIRKYMRKHKVVNHSKTNVFVRCNLLCPFRNDKEKKCDIYEVRPYICRIFKCDTEPRKAEWVRDEIEKTREVYSMKALFFEDYSTEEYLHEF